MKFLDRYETKVVEVKESKKNPRKISGGSEVVFMWTIPVVIVSLII